MPTSRAVATAEVQVAACYTGARLVCCRQSPCSQAAGRQAAHVHIHICVCTAVQLYMHEHTQLCSEFSCCYRFRPLHAQAHHWRAKSRVTLSRTLLPGLSRPRNRGTGVHQLYNYQKQCEAFTQGIRWDRLSPVRNTDSRRKCRKTKALRSRAVLSRKNAFCTKR